jgi:hypothetical protein
LEPGHVEDDDEQVGSIPGHVDDERLVGKRHGERDHFATGRSHVRDPAVPALAMPAPLRDALWLARGLAPIRSRQR